MNDREADSPSMEPRKAGGWRRALKWIAIGSVAYIVVVFGWSMLSYIEDEPDDYPSNFVVNLTGRRVELYRIDEADDGVLEAVVGLSGNHFFGVEDSCGSFLFVAFESVGYPSPPIGSSVDASELADRTEIGRTTDPLCGDDYWVIIEGGGRVMPQAQYDRERLDGPFVRNLVDDDVDLFRFEWDDPAVLTGVGRVSSDFLRPIPELAGEECADLGLVAFAASGEAIPNPNVEYQIGELADRSELGRTTEPLCLREYWLIEDGGARAVPESEYER